jgi:predicted RNA-binding Zn ribbon-like protein
MASAGADPPAALHDGSSGVLCLDFVNSVGRAFAAADRGVLAVYRDFLRWTQEAGCLPAARLRSLERAAARRRRELGPVLARAVVLRDALERGFRALVQGAGPDQDDLDAVSAEVARSLAHARIEAHGAELAWAWDPDPMALDAPLWPVARSAADLLTGTERTRIKECASAACRWFFLDVTKNRARRWCDMKVCGNRAKVQEHRRRQRARESE